MAISRETQRGGLIAPTTKFRADSVASTHYSVAVNPRLHAGLPTNRKNERCDCASSSGVSFRLYFLTCWCIEGFRGYRVTNSIGGETAAACD